MEEAFLIKTPPWIVLLFVNGESFWIIHFQHAEKKNIYI